MTVSVRNITVPVATGRSVGIEMQAADYPSKGQTMYAVDRHPGETYVRRLNILVQNVPYADGQPASGMPLEAFYAILKDQLEIEIGTVGEAKKEALTAALGLLNGSLDILLGVNAVPEQVGEVNA